MDPIIHTIYEKATGTWQYVVACPITKCAAIIDPVLDLDILDISAFTINTHSADELLSLVSKEGYTVTHLLETHAHADHLTASFYLQQALVAAGEPRPSICIGQNIRKVQKTFGPKYGIPADELAKAFDHLFSSDEEFSIGQLTVNALDLPGHTPDHVGYLVGQNVFTGDSIFNPDVGSARCDFPGGDARALFKSMKTILALPSTYKLYTGHDYPPTSDGKSQRGPMPYVTVEEQNERNKHAKLGSTEEDFVSWRTERDQGLTDRRLLHQAMQVNIRGGRMPCTTHAGKVFVNFLVKVPDMLCHS